MAMSSPELGPVKRRLDARSIMVTVVGVILVGLVVPPWINVSRYRARIADSISRALGRPVTIGSISLRLLPQPGFDLGNLVIGDDPAISYEPILVAGEVNASLRLSSLWRGHFEIARLHLKYPSLNLARSPNGEWNLESLLWQAARTQTAPTASPPQQRPRFPYIEAEGGRINFKFGLEKSFFALTEADFALWSPTENEWRMRLQATPFRTDTNISDTGILRAEGAFRRAALLRDMPLQMRINWSGGQLGQITKLIYGRDRGWRGGVQLSATLDGTPAALQTSASGSVQDFRRYDISRGEALRLYAKCSSKFSVVDRTLRGLSCQMPLQQGSLQFEGQLTATRLHPYDLQITMKQIPAEAVTAFLRHAKRDLPNDLSASGAVNGSFSGHRAGDGSPAKWSGSGTGKGLVLRSATLGKDLEVGTVRFFAAAASLPPLQPAASADGAGKTPSPESQQQLVFDSFAVPLGGSAPVTASAWLSPTAHSLHLQGDATLERLLQAARAIGVAVPRYKFSGAAKVDLTLRGNWAGFAMVRPFGRAQLRATRVEIPGIASPVQMQSAQLEIAEDRLDFHNIAGQIGKIGFTGEVQVPRSCDDAPKEESTAALAVSGTPPCVSRFDVQADTVSLDELNAQFNPFSNVPWYKLLAPGGGSGFATMQASGRISARRLLLRQLTLTKFASDFRLQGGRLVLSNSSAELLGGMQSGQWQADFTGSEPVYSGMGTVANISAGQIAGLLRTPIGTGKVNAKYQLTMKGWSAGDLWTSAAGAADFDWRNGSWHSVQLARMPLLFSSFIGHLALADGKFTVAPGRMQGRFGAFTVQGSVSNGQLALRLDRGETAAYRLSGTLQKPLLEAPPAATGALRKP
jgi:hypothetical protein